MAILQTDPERFGCIEGQGDYSGPDAHTAHSTGMLGEMEKEQAPKTPARGTGRKRGRPKGSGSGRGRASSKGASPSQSPKPVTIGSVLIRVPFFSLLLSCFRCSAYLVMFFSLFKCNPFLSFLSDSFHEIKPICKFFSM